MHNFMEILRLKFEMQFSYRIIAQTLAVGTSTVHDIIERFNNLGLSWPLPDNHPPDKLEKILFQGHRGRQRSKIVPDWLTVDTELSRKGMTRQLLWQEYLAEVGTQAMSYS